MLLKRPTFLGYLLLAMLVSGGCSGHGKPTVAGPQLSFGVEMARRGLWNEALFRFEQALKIEPNNPRILNNLAVASEAKGDFDQAQRYYQDALRINASDAEVKRNYARFVEFFQSYKSREESATEASPPASDGAAEESDQSTNGDAQVLVR